MSKATSQACSSYRRNRTVLSFRERYRLTVFVSNGTGAVMAQRGVSLKSVLTCYEKNKMIFFFIWAVIDLLTINISCFLLNIKQHPSPISRKPQTVLNVWMAWIVCIVLFSYHKCACPMSRAIAATFWPRGRRALRECKKIDFRSWALIFRVLAVSLTRYWPCCLYWMKKIFISMPYVYRKLGCQDLRICPPMLFLVTSWSIVPGRVVCTVGL